MPKNSELQKHTMNLRKGDMDRIAEYYPDVPAALIVRKVLSAFVDQIEAGGETSINAKVEIKL